MNEKFNFENATTANYTGNIKPLKKIPISVIWSSKVTRLLFVNGTVLLCPNANSGERSTQEHLETETQVSQRSRENQPELRTKGDSAAKTEKGLCDFCTGGGSTRIVLPMPLSALL